MPVAGHALFDRVDAALAPFGLMPRGGFAFSAGDDAPAGPDGQHARSVLLVGHGGDLIWKWFRAWRKQQQTNLVDPLDAWSKSVIGTVAERFGARAVFPSDPPYLPFQQWAMRAEGLRPSPLGLLMHPVYGLWHAYRGALLFRDVLPLPTASMAAHPCDACSEKPCLGACPVRAFSHDGFDVQSCRTHVRSSEGAACREQGCLARNACAVGIDYRYAPEQQRFHQSAFLGG